MNRHVNAIAGRLSLRPPQRQLAGDPRPHHGDRAAPKRRPTSQAALDVIRSRVPDRRRISSASFRRSASPWPPASARRG